MMMSFLSSRVAVAAPRMMLRRPLLMSPPRTMTTLTLSPPPQFAAQSMFSALMPSPSFALRATGLQQSLESLLSWSTWLIKRTFQPSIIRKRRKTGLLTRNKTVGGRRILKRRKKKGRARLAGC